MTMRLTIFLVLLLAGATVGCQDTSSSSSSRKPLLGTVVHVSLRPSLLEDQTAVLQITNTSSTPLEGISIGFHNNDSNQKGTHSIARLQPRGKAEIGILEASCVIEPNETITISCGGYTPLKYVTYRTEQGAVGFRQAWW